MTEGYTIEAVGHEYIRANGHVFKITRFHDHGKDYSVHWWSLRHHILCCYAAVDGTYPDLVEIINRWNRGQQYADLDPRTYIIKLGYGSPLGMLRKLAYGIYDSLVH